MKILMITSEAVPFSKSGGLADVVGDLSQALSALGCTVKVLVPSYDTSVADSGEKLCTLRVSVLGGPEKVEIATQMVGSVQYCLLCHPVFNNRKGIYGPTSFEPYADNFFRYSLLCKSALKLCESQDFEADWLWCHDWASGMLPYMIKQARPQALKDARTIFTIHNLAYQGTFARMDFLFTLNKPNELLFADGRINMMQAGIAFADIVTTVSPTYAKEIQGSVQGCSLDWLLRRRSSSLFGIINGIDTEAWNPETDELIASRYSKDDLSGKALCKADCQQRFGLEIREDVPLFTMVSRLAWQKGIRELCLALEEELDKLDIQVLIIGTGDKNTEDDLIRLHQKHPNLSVNFIFSNKAAHQAEAGGDFFLMPSHYEPCGLNQMFSMRYGNLPIAHRTGGRADTIIDYQTGLLMDSVTVQSIREALQRAVDLHHRKEDMKAMMIKAMEMDFSWNASAAQYMKLLQSQ